MKLIRLPRPATLSLALAFAAVPLIAQNASPEQKAPAAQTVNPPQPARQPGAGPFHGKLATVDKAARTITVGKRTFQITPETRINREGKPATLEQAVVGEPVSGYVKPNSQGTLVATTLNLGPKTSDKNASTKKAPAAQPK